MTIPLAALGNPIAGDTIRVSAMVNGSNHDYLSNQMLGGLPAGQGNLGGDGNGGFNGTVGQLDMNNFAGNQYFVIAVPEPSSFKLVELDGEPYLMIEMEFMKPGKGQAVYRAKLKNLITGRVIDRNYRSGESLAAAQVEETSLQYLYHDATHWHFMDPQSYEQHAYLVPRLRARRRALQHRVAPVIAHGGPVLAGMGERGARAQRQIALDPVDAAIDRSERNQPPEPGSEHDDRSLIHALPRSGRITAISWACYGEDARVSKPTS